MRWVQLACVALGVLGLIGLVLVQPDEERRFRNVLVDWWTSTTEAGETLLDKHAAFARMLASKLLDHIDIIFGRKVLATRLAIGSLFTLYAATALTILACFVLTFRDATWPWPWPVIVLGAWVIAPCLMLGRYIYSQRRRTSIAYLCVASFMIAIDALKCFHNAAKMLCAIGLLFANNAITVYANRKLLRRATIGDFGIYALPLLLAVPSVCLAIGGWYWYNYEYHTVSVSVVQFLFVSASVNVAIAYALLIIVLAFAINSAFWGVLSRVLQTLHVRISPDVDTQTAGMWTARSARSAAT